jgi:hypothetical protein
LGGAKMAKDFPELGGQSEVTPTAVAQK